MFGHKSMRRIVPWAIGAACAAGLMVPQSALAAPKAPAAVTYTQLTLVNGWTNYGSGTARAAVADISGIITFKGAIRSNATNPVAFTLPKAFRPAANLYIPVDMCDANKGRLFIQPNGVTEVASEASFSNATCFTSLDGVSFAQSAASFTPLALRNGWHDFGAGTARPAARVISGIVHLRGAIKTGGTNNEPFVLPKGFRPAATVSVDVNLCSAHNGQLTVLPNGGVFVNAEIAFSDLQCLTSLDGASFAISGSSFTQLALKNGWQNIGGGDPKAGARVISGIVYLRGAIKTVGTSGAPFVLPKSMRPRTDVYVSVDLFSSNYGRLFIQPNGVVEIEEEGATFPHAAAFTSLDGAWFAH